MVKKGISGLLIMIMTMGLISVQAVYGAADITEDFRGVWVGTVMSLDFPSKPGISSVKMIEEINAILDRTVELNLNAVVLQVRPCADAIYKSELFPWSEYLTGQQGKAPDNDFDPLAYWITQAHARGLELHAWVNPYRVSHSSAKRSDVSTLSPNNKARLNPSWVIPYKDGGLYFDPGLPETQKLIVDGVAEIIKNYEVDGIHLDDYFYPGTDFKDDVTYTKYGNGMSKDDWRRENVNTLIKTLQDTIREMNPNIRFGISPFGIWQNKASSALGSDTRGNESYKAMYADTRKWVKEGWLDYICPQIYWNISFEIADYRKLLDWWVDVCTGTNVDLYIGHAAYKEYDGSAPYQGEMVRQLRLNSGFDVVKGSVFFRYGSISGELGNQIKAFYSNKLTAAPDTRKYTLSVQRPDKNITTSNDSYYILGTSVPGKSLYMNEQYVTNRSAGYFGAFVKLKPGENVFTFKQEEQTPVTLSITYKAPNTGNGGSAAKPQIKDTSNLSYYGTVTGDDPWTYAGGSTSSGSIWELVKGQRDVITGVIGNNDWVRLGTGQWIQGQFITCAYEDAFINNRLEAPVYKKSADTDTITWKTSAQAATRVSYDGDVFKMNFAMTDTLPAISLPDGAVFESSTTAMSNGNHIYIFKPAPGARIEGYYVTSGEGTISLNIKKRKKAAEGDKPLSGIKLVIDAGHGLDDKGAVGPLGLSLPEKELNLTNATKLSENLKSLGATVINVRNKDDFFSLNERTAISRRERPDLFISIHANSLDESTDSSKINGLTIWYKNPNSKPFADFLMNRIFDINPLTNRQNKADQANLYVCRPYWTPSVIIEASFMCNVNDFNWLVRDEKQNELADAIAKGILAYFS